MKKEREFFLRQFRYVNLIQKPGNQRYGITADLASFAGMVMNRTININTTNHIQMKAIVVMSTQPEDNKILNTDRSDLPTFLLFVTVFSEMLKSPLSIIAYQPTFFFIYLAFINGTQLAVLSCVTTFLMCMMLIAASRLFYLDHKGTLESHVIERCKHDKLLTWLKKRFSS